MTRELGNAKTLTKWNWKRKVQSLKAEKLKSAPKMGDNTKIIVWVVLLVVLAGAAIVVALKKKNRRNKNVGVVSVPDYDGKYCCRRISGTGKSRSTKCKHRKGHGAFQEYSCGSDYRGAESKS